MDTYSDNNSAPPEYPEQSAGSSVSSRFQDEYEELLKYAVVVPKIDVDDLPRVLADSKRHLTQSCRLPTPSEEIHTSSGEEDEGSVAAKPLPQIVPTKQGLGRILTPARKPSNKESDIETVTPKTRVSPSQQYHHKHHADDTESDLFPNRHGNKNTNAATGSDSGAESEDNILLETTLQRSVELAPSASDLSDIERKLDLWSRQVNSNIIDEISRLRIKLLENARHKLQTTESRHAGEINTMYNELEGLKELLHTYEVSIERKDGVISNLTRSLQNQKEKFDTMKTFTDWKLQFAAKKQEGYAMKLAAQHHNNAIRRKCWKKWHMVIVEKWRRRVEKACQAKAQEICISLTSDYESKLQSLEEKYNASRGEVMSLHKEREYYEENMKKAFMRGVCALNMEAMNMFHEPEGEGDPQQDRTGSQSRPQTHLDSCTGNEENATPHSLSAATIQQHSRMFSAPSPVASRSYTVPHGPAYTTEVASTTSLLKGGRGGKRLTATVTAKPGKPGKPGTARKMSGQPVLVERHDNVGGAGDASVQTSIDQTLRSSAGRRKEFASRVVKIVK